MVDQLFVKQSVEILEAFNGFETKNKYEVFNSLGQQILYSKEDSAAAQLGPSTWPSRTYRDKRVM